MKKSLKILTLVLSLALICGALVVAAFAGDTEVAGITVMKSTDFTGSGFTANDKGTITTGFNWNNTSVGQYGVVTDKDGNNYFNWNGEISADQNAANKNCYITTQPTWLDITKYNMKEGTHTQPGTMDLYDHVVELDVFAPTGSYEAIGSYIKAMVYGWDPDFRMSSGSFCSNLNVEVLLKTGEDGVSYLSWGGQKVLLESDSWSHITIAVTSDIIDNEYLSFNAYIWVNDKLVISKPGYGTTLNPNVGGNATANPPKPEAADGYDKLTSYVLGEVRVQPQASNKYDTTKEMSMAVDNITVQQITKATYNGNLYEVIENGGNLTEWESNNYDRTTMPYGKTVVTNTSTGVEYDNLQYAIDCAEPTEELVLSANVISDVIVNKDLVIFTGDYTTGAIEAAKGYAGVEIEGGWQFEESDEVITIEWTACDCGEDACDETHPGDVMSEVGIGGNIFKTYTKSMDWTYTNEETLTTYKLVGWEDDNGNIYDDTTVMTPELVEECGGYLVLYPIIDTATPTYKYIRKGVVTYGYADTISLKDAIYYTDAGTTFTFINDVVLNPSSNPISGYISKNLTIDFGGKTILSITTGTKAALFSVSNGFEVTFMTSVPGAKIIHGHDTGKGPENKEAFQGQPMFQVGGASTVIRINGEGLTTFCPTVIDSASNNGTDGAIYVNGGTYIQPYTCGDNAGLVQLYSFRYASFKNATLYTATRNIFGVGGIHHKGEIGECVLDVDNCNLISPGAPISKWSYVGLTVNITNSLIAGDIALTGMASTSNTAFVKPVFGGTWNIGEGCTIKQGAKLTANEGATINVVDGYIEAPYSETVKFTLPMVTFTTGDLEATKTVYDTEVEVTIGSKIVKEVKPITVNWLDVNGNLMGTTTATPGYVATAPGVAIADGWVNEHYTTWTNQDGVTGEALVPEDATDGYTFKLVEGSKATYSAGKVPVYINYDLVLHFQLNIYVTQNLPEGVTDLAYTWDGANRTFTKSGTFIINGEKIYLGQQWPGATGADDDASMTVTYKYNGQDVVYSVPAFNMGDYAKAIFNGDYTTEMKQAVLSTVNYVNSVNVYKNQTPSAELTAAIALAAEKGITIENAVIDTTATGDYSAISEYITSAEIYYYNGATILLRKTEAAKTAGVTAYFIGSTGKAQKSPKDDGVWYWTNTRAYEFDDVVTIEIRDDATGEVLVSCEYSAMAYAAAMWDNLTDAQKDFIVATMTMAKYVDAIK